MFTTLAFDAEKLRRHRDEQAGLGFPLLRRCPNTNATSLLLFLDASGAEAGRTYAAELTAFEKAQAEKPPQTNQELQDLARGFPLFATHMGPVLGLTPPEARPRDFRTMPVKALATLLEEAGPGGVAQIAKTLLLSEDPAARLPAPTHAASLDEIAPVPPAKLRNLVDQIMKEEFGGTASRIGKDHTVYDVSHAVGALRLHAMFAPAGRLAPQFDYLLDITIGGRAKVSVSYEQVWRLPATWNYLTKTNAQRSAAHLKELIRTCVALV